MRFRCYLFALLIVSLIYIPDVFSKTVFIHYKKAQKDKWEDFKYSDKINKSQVRGIPYYEVNYSRGLILSEKHYSSSNKLIFIAKYTYTRLGAFTKVEIHFDKKLIKVKRMKPLSKGVRDKFPNARYSEIKYLSFYGKVRKLYRVEEYYSNGQVMIISYYNALERLEKQDIYARNSKKKSTKYYRYVAGKNLVWKEDTFDRKKGTLTGYWEYKFDSNGKETEKKFYPADKKKASQ
ncbi:MAG: hypothetical protein OEZ36_01065 [Spirochaetota bacterium]|nr:hypothetical protein [Spirochaetota bacterium]